MSYGVVIGTGLTSRSAGFVYLLSRILDTVELLWWMFEQVLHGARKGVESPLSFDSRNQSLFCKRRKLKQDQEEDNYIRCLHAEFVYCICA